MDIAVVPFTPAHLPLVARFSERYWTRPRTEAFYRWRYLNSQPFSRMVVAIGGGECVGMVSALRKDYLIGGHPVPCLEVFDWHCLPELKGTGAGIRVMRAMMREPERVIAFGGTADVLSALPAMGWQAIGVGRVFELPTSGQFLATGLRRRVGLPGAVTRLPLETLARAWFRPKPRNVPFDGQTSVGALLTSDANALYAGEIGYDMVQRPSVPVLRWLGSGVNNGSFEYLQFTVKGHLAGWAMTRLYDTPQGREGAIVDIFAPRPDEDLYTWMISEAAMSLAAGHPWMIRARASCAILGAALGANRFRQAEGDVPVNTWPKGLPAMRRVHVTLNHSDEPIRPYRRAD